MRDAGQDTLLVGEESREVADVVALVRLSAVVQAVFGEVADVQHLPSVQARMLCVLADQPRRMSELARACNVEKAAVTGLVDRADSRGYVVRAAVPGDRRVSLVTLTSAGFRAAMDFHTEVTKRLDQWLDKLEPGDRRLLGALVANLLSNPV